MEARNLKWIGLATWLIVAIPSTSWLADRGLLATPNGLAWGVLYIAFGVIFAIDASVRFSQRAVLVLIAAQTLSAIGGMLFEPYLANKFQPVLLVIVCAQLGAMPRRIAYSWFIAQNVIYTAIVWLAANDSVFEVVASYAAFQLFALFSVQVAHREQTARQQLTAANAELKVATGLLDMSSRTSERLRIARDLHDLLGHHLTALSINLEVATHVANAEALESIEKSRSIAKHLLADVRDVVSRLRDDEPVDFAAALQSLRDVINTPSLHLDVASSLAVRDSSVAQVALRAVQEIVTNAVRHSNARNLWIDVSQTDGTLSIKARDDGEGADHVQLGNGLRGMRERIEEANGRMEIESMKGKGFAIAVELPLQ